MAAFRRRSELATLSSRSVSTSAITVTCVPVSLPLRRSATAVTAAAAAAAQLQPRALANAPLLSLHASPQICLRTRLLRRTLLPRRPTAAATAALVRHSSTRASSSVLGQDPSPPSTPVMTNTIPGTPNGANTPGSLDPTSYFPRSGSPPRTDYDTSLDEQARDLLHVRGLLPPSIESFQMQKLRCLEQIKMKSTAIDKYSYLSNLRNTNVNLFYRLLIDNMKELTPYVYTPTVGEACVKWSHIYTHPEGLYLSYMDRGNLRAVLDNWPQKAVEITVITDGSRILGLGDLGVNGMGIPVGKLALYTGCAGIHPERTLPITLDFGTDNEDNLKDPLYMGAKMHRVSEENQLAFMDEMMIALNDKWPGLLVQFEDFKNPFPSLARYRNTYTCFNDDIQGTGAVILGGVINAFEDSKRPLNEHKLVFMGAGSAAVGVAKQICDLFVRNGIPEDKAKAMFWLVDSRGLVTTDRGDKLQDHKVYFARCDNGGEQYKSLEEVVDYVKPTALVGLCTIGGIFSEAIVRKMAELNEQPVIFPLSNPSSKSECTYEDAMKWTNNRVVFASGSPFPSVFVDGVEKTPGQGNNMYVFPGIGLGTVLCEAAHVTDAMIYASATGVAKAVTPEERAKGWLYPELARIRDISVIVARDVIRAAQKEGVDRNKKLQWLSDIELEKFIRDRMYDPMTATASRAGSREPSRPASPAGTPPIRVGVSNL